MTRPPVVLVALVAAVALAPVVVARVEAQVETIKIGVLSDRTGPFAAAGALANARGVKIAIDAINEGGGVLGKYRVVAVDADTQSKTDVAIAEAERLFSVERVDMLSGVFASAQAVPLAEKLDKQQRVFWITGAVSDAVFRGRNLHYVFRPHISSDMIGAVAVQYVASWAPEKLGKPAQDVKPAIVFEDGAFGAGVAAENENEAKKFGMQVLLKESYPPTAQDFAAVLNKLTTMRPEVLFHAGYGADVPLFARQFRQAKLKVRVMIGHGPGHSQLERLKEALGRDVEGFHAVDVVQAPQVAAKLLKPAAAEATQHMVRHYQAEFGPGEVPVQVSVGFTSTWILLTNVLPRAIGTHGGVGPDAVLKAARETDIADGGTPQGYGVRFYPPGHAMAGQNARAFPAVYQVIDGKFEIVFPPAIASATPVLPLPPSSAFALPPGAAVGPIPIPVKPGPGAAPAPGATPPPGGTGR
ncbi:MAG: ABC transporter substrate-binding protein [Candidatus Rokubacteria bacterium]|nr:ABC transporter substrate-binding protein [Candidatus Rokubacteria bacterium]